MQGTTGRTARAVVAGLAFLLVAAPARAQEGYSLQNHLYDTFQAGLSFTTVLNYSNARVDGSGGEVGTKLDFRKALGITEATVQPAIGLRWKPGRKTEFDLGYQFLNQTGARSFNDTLVIGEDSLTGDLDLDSKIHSDNLTFQFKYALFATEKHNIGLALGLGAIFFGLDIDGTAEGCAGPNCGGTSFNSSRSFTGPTASLGAFGQFRLSNHWYVGADARLLGANVDRYDFSVFEGNVGGQYFLSDRWGLGLGWYYTDVTVDVGAKSDGSVAGELVGNVSYSYSSLRLGVVAAF